MSQDEAIFEKPDNFNNNIEISEVGSGNEADILENNAAVSISNNMAQREQEGRLSYVFKLILLYYQLINSIWKLNIKEKIKIMFRKKKGKKKIT